MEIRKELVEKKKSRYRSLAGAAKAVGEDKEELTKLAKREESWRDKEVE